MSLVPRCDNCCELVPRCECEMSLAFKVRQPMPDDPDERMRIMKGCTVAEYDATREKMIRKGGFL